MKETKLPTHWSNLGPFVQMFLGAVFPFLGAGLTLKRGDTAAGIGLMCFALFFAVLLCRSPVRADFTDTALEVSYPFMTKVIPWKTVTAVKREEKSLRHGGRRYVFRVEYPGKNGKSCSLTLPDNGVIDYWLRIYCGGRLH